MTNSLENRVKRLKEQGFNLSIDKVLNDAFNSWKHILFYGVLVILFSYLFNILVDSFFSSLLQTKDLDIKFQEGFNKLITTSANLDKMIPLLESYSQNPLILTKLILTNIVSLLIFPLGAGLVYSAYKFDTQGSSTLKDLIQGFQGYKFLNLIGLSFIYIITLIISAFLFFIPALYFATAFILAGAFIIIDDAPLLKAIKYSFQIVNMKFFQFFLILIISFLISRVLGAFMCLVGLLLTLPFSFAIVYSLYKNTLGTLKPEDTEHEQAAE